MKRLYTAVIIFLLISVASFYLYTIFLLQTPSTLTKPFSKSNSVASYSFILMGDTGTGAVSQYEVAKSIENYCSERENCKAVFILGDVIYDEGVKSITDTQFTTKFENPYKDISLPFYILFGNHDYLGCTSCYLEYDKESPKWEMSSGYYLQKFNSISFYALDTENFDEEQKKWLTTQIKNDTSTWKIVLGHKPIKTFEETKVKEDWKGRDELKEIVCNSADFYVSGHSHILEDPGTINGCYVKQLISGTGGSYPREVQKPYQGNFFYEGNGFLVMTVQDNLMTINFFDKSGKSLHEVTSWK